MGSAVETTWVSGRVVVVSTGSSMDVAKAAKGLGLSCASVDSVFTDDSVGTSWTGAVTSRASARAKPS